MKQLLEEANTNQPQIKQSNCTCKI